MLLKIRVLLGFYPNMVSYFVHAMHLLGVIFGV